MKRSITLLLSVLVMTLAGCSKKSFIDDTEFALYYKSIKPFTLGQEAVSKPSYIGETPEDFQIYSIMHNLNLYYSPKIDGELEADDTFYIDPATGDFKIQKTSDLKPGTYKVSIRCKSGGKSYQFPDAIVIEISK